MRFVLYILAVLACTPVSAQMQIEKKTHDFGDLYANATTYVDFTFKNIGQAKTYLLTVDKPREVSYIYSSKTIQAGEDFTLRLKINDNIKGRFNYLVDVYFSNSNKPTTLRLYGNVKERNNSPLTACPDFNASPPKGGLAHFDVTVKVIDSLTREPIRRSKVYLINNGDMIGMFYTNSQGIIHENVPLGLYYITAQKSPYKSNYHEGYLNYQSNYVEIELQKEAVIEETEAPDDIATTTIIIEEQPDVVEVEETVDEEEMEEEVETEIEEVVEETVEEVVEETPVVVDSADFNSTLYPPNNIIFIVDVSASMNQMGKMDLLKLSMIELTKILRPQDKVSLIAYSGSVTTLLEFESGANKEEIIVQVKSLHAGGYTAGGDAIKEGIKMAKRGYIEGGNNLIFMVTDGAFNKGTKDYVRNIQNTYNTKGIKFSVVGIKPSNT